MATALLLEDALALDLWRGSEGVGWVVALSRVPLCHCSLLVVKSWNHGMSLLLPGPF